MRVGDMVVSDLDRHVDADVHSNEGRGRSIYIHVHRL